MASTLRLIGHHDYVLITMIVFLAISFPLSSFVSVFVFHKGVFSCVASLVICDTLEAVTLIVRYIYRLEVSVKSSISMIERTDKEFLSIQELIKESDSLIEETS